MVCSAVAEVELLGLVVACSAVVEVELLGLVVACSAVAEVELLVAPYSAPVCLTVVTSVCEEVGCLATLGVVIRYRAIVTIFILYY